jgi:hypothetical protein
MLVSKAEYGKTANPRLWFTCENGVNIICYLNPNILNFELKFKILKNPLLPSFYRFLHLAA